MSKVFFFLSIKRNLCHTVINVLLFLFRIFLFPYSQAAVCLITVRDVIMAHGRQRMISTSVEGTALSAVRDGLEGTVSVSDLCLSFAYLFFLIFVFFSYVRSCCCFSFSMWRSNTETSRSCDPGELSDQCRMRLDATC